MYREQNIIPAGGDLKQPAKILKRLKSHIQNGSLSGKNPGDVVEYDGKYGALPETIASQSKMHKKANYERQVLGIPHDLACCHPLGHNPGDFWPYPTMPSDDYWCPNCRNFVKQKDIKCVRCGAKVIAHFAVYPKQLCERPIKSSCPPDGVVLDPMCGSGTTLVVAKRLGRRSIGIDLNPDYCEMARRRLGQVESPLEVFA